MRGTTDDLLGRSVADSGGSAPAEDDGSGSVFSPVRSNLDAQRTALGLQGPTTIEGLIADEPIPLAEQFQQAGQVDPATTGTIGRVEAVGPLQTGVGAPVAAPYSAPGIQIGTITLRPSVEIGATYTHRTSRDEDAGPPAQIVTSTSEARDVEVIADVAFEGDFGASQLSGDVDITLPFSVDDGSFDSVTTSGNATLFRELADEQQITATAGFTYDAEDPRSAAVSNATGGATDPVVTADPSTLTLNGTIGYQRPVGPVVTGATLGVSRTMLGDVSLSDGSEISQSDLNSTSYTAQLRGALDTGAILSPFVELDLGLRRFDDDTDANGLDRNSRDIALRGGVEFDLGDKLNGEIAAGYFFENIEQRSLPDLAGLSLEGALNWSPRRDIDIGLSLSTETEPTGDANTSGSIVYSFDSDVDYRARANLTLNGSFGVEIDDEVKSDDDTATITGQVGATYWYNRFAGITGRVGYEQTLSDQEANRSEEWSAFIGLRMQR
ncbi:MAG: outer membrane beta-barrel protein [Pseudomonadota bacterium]